MDHPKYSEIIRDDEHLELLLIMTDMDEMKSCEKSVANLRRFAIMIVRYHFVREDQQSIINDVIEDKMSV